MKFRAALRYQALDFLKPVIIFYAIIYTVVGSTIVISAANGTSSSFINMTEINSLGFLAVCIPITFGENFRFLLQNGFTRKIIFGSAVAEFALLSLVMSLVDTFIPTLLQRKTIFTATYGEQSLLLHFIWMLSVYFTACMIPYALTVLYHRIGQKYFLLGMAILFIALIPLLALAVRAGTPLENISRLLSYAMGFINDRIQLLFPICTFLTASGAAALAAYGLIRRAEIR